MELQASDFTSSVEKVDEITSKITITIPVVKVNSAVDSEIVKLLPRLNLKGFRPGKAPKQLVEKTHGERVRAEVTYDLMNQSLREVLKSNKIETVGSPVVDVSSVDRDKDLAFTAQISIFPQPEIKGFEKIKVKAKKLAVTEEQINEQVKRVRKSKAKVKALEGRDVAKDGDVVNGDLWVRIEGKTDDAVPEPVSVVLGEARLPKELEAKISGIKVGETVEVQRNPDDAEPVAGQKINSYKFTLKGLSTEELPELDDAFAQSLPDYAVKTFDELKAKIKETLEKDFEERNQTEVQSAIIDKLIEENAFLVPQVMVDEEIVGMARRIGLFQPEKQPTQEEVERLRPMLSEVSTKRVKGSIIIDRIAVQKDLKAEQADIDAALKERAAMYGTDETTARNYFLAKERALGFLVEVNRTKILSWLVQTAEVEYESA